MLFSYVYFFGAVLAILLSRWFWSWRVAPKFKPFPSEQATISPGTERAIHCFIAVSDEFKTDVASLSSKWQVYEKSAEVMKKFISQSGFTVEDVKKEQSAKLFEFHRKFPSRQLLGELAPDGGLAVRVTVQFNLFCGSIVNLGCKEQQNWLKGVLERCELGCFLLTEHGAGVLSGLIVQTVCTWNGTGFTLDSAPPVERSRKSWISQGLVAKWGVVIARLLIAGKDKGPHAFIVDMNSEGVDKEDMPQKTTYNSLDNAFITFRNVKLPRDALLSGHAFVDDDGEYHLRDESKPFSFITVAQRLLSGRIALSGYSLGKIQVIAKHTREYALQRKLPTFGSSDVMPLAELPVMRDTLDEIDKQWKVYNHYVMKMERKYRNATSFNDLLVHQIACAKIECLDWCLRSVYKMKERVGAYAVRFDSAFNSEVESFYLARFAEGDSAILQQKMARDHVKALRSPLRLLQTLLAIPLFLFTDFQLGVTRAALAVDLVRLALRLQGKSKKEQLATWLRSHSLVEAVAKRCALLTIFDTVREDLANTEELHEFCRYLRDN